MYFTNILQSPDANDCCISDCHPDDYARLSIYELKSAMEWITLLRTRMSVFHLVDRVRLNNHFGECSYWIEAHAKIEALSQKG